MYPLNDFGNFRTLCERHAAIAGLGVPAPGSPSGHHVTVAIFLLAHMHDRTTLPDLVWRLEEMKMGPGVHPLSRVRASPRLVLTNLSHSVTM